MENLFVQRLHVFVDADAVGEDLNVEALHMGLLVEDRRWLWCLRLERFRVVFIYSIFSPCVLSEKSLM